MPKLKVFFIIAIALISSISILITGCTNNLSQSSLTGLATMKAMTKETIAYDLALANGKPTLIEFYADWCTSCQSLAPTLKSLHQKYSDRINFVMINIDQPQWTPQLKEYQVSGVPQITLLDSEHSIVNTFVGLLPKTVLATDLENL
ncbi:MAG: thioredoxin fold domain-containing protein [Moorea sp. SIO2B7]|nr:thioredoxin fold domain-containing protein [Moorena sp. SIO2B7]